MSVMKCSCEGRSGPDGIEWQEFARVAGTYQVSYEMAEQQATPTERMTLQCVVPPNCPWALPQPRQEAMGWPPPRAGHMSCGGRSHGGDPMGCNPWGGRSPGEGAWRVVGVASIGRDGQWRTGRITGAHASTRSGASPQPHRPEQAQGLRRGSSGAPVHCGCFGAGARPSL